MNAPTAPSAPSVNTLPAGTRLQDFEVREVLGVGGFGIVYRAFDHALERDVALKEYMPSALADRTATMHVSLRSSASADTFALGLRSFVNEARLLARFDHPSLVKVYRFWEANGTAYMVMQLYRGRTLKELVGLGVGPRDEASLRKILLPLLGALERLHDDGVFHRDISPDNIVIEPDGHPVLLDFGAARHVIADRSQNLTAILKPSYAPIEQYAEAGGVKQGPWTDFYALGATLHFVLLGKAPPQATARAIEDGMVPLASQSFAGYSQGFLQIVDWMLAPRPNDRPRSVAELRNVLSGRSAVPAAGLTLTGSVVRPLDDDATVVLAPRSDLLDVTVVDPPPTSARAAQPTVPPMPTMPSLSVPSPVPPRTVSLPPPGPTTQRLTPAPDPGKLSSKRSGLTLLAMIGGYSAVAGAALWWFFFMRGAPAPAPAPVVAATAPAPAPVSAMPPAPPPAVESPASAAVVAPAPSLTPPPSAPPITNLPAASPTPAPPPVATDAGTRVASAPRRTPVPAPAPKPMPAAIPPVVVDSGVPPGGAYPPAQRPVQPPPAAPRVPAPTPTPAPAPPPVVVQSPREACGSRVLVALWNCMDRECARPEFARHGECVKWREMRERQRNSESQ